MAKIAFLGAGRMAQGMIRNLLRAGHEVAVYNRSLDKARVLEADGALASRTPREAAAGADVIFSMVTDDAASRACWCSTDGALAAGQSGGAFAVESSTISNGWARALGARAAEAGFRFLDCPVAGRPEAAAAGQLALFIGGRTEDVEALRPILSPMARTITHFGPAGTGNAFKLIYNLMGAVQLAALAEALFACEIAGIDLAAAAAAFSSGSTGSPHVVRHAQFMARGEHESPVQFSGNGRLKDIGYGVEFTEGIGAQSVVGQAADRVFRQMTELGLGKDSDSRLIDALRLAHGRLPVPKR